MSSLFMKLPAELRMCVYEYTFEDNTPAEIELFKALQHYPEPALLGTCREIYNEAKPTHFKAAAQFRSSKTFTIMLDRKIDTSSKIIKLMDRLDALKFPLLVRQFRVDWFGSTTSMDCEIDADDKVRIDAQADWRLLPGSMNWIHNRGDGTAWFANMLEKKIPNKRDYVARSRYNGKALFAVYDILILILKMSLDPEDRAGLYVLTKVAPQMEKWGPSCNASQRFKYLGRRWEIG